MLKPPFLRRQLTADADANQRKVKKGPQTAKPAQAEPEADQQAGSTAEFLPDLIRDSLWQVLGPQTLLAVCLVAAWALRQALLPADLVRWGLGGTLPYLRMAADCAPLLAAAPHPPPVSALQPTGAARYGRRHTPVAYVSSKHWT